LEGAEVPNLMVLAFGLTLTQKIKVIAFACASFGIKITNINMKPKLLPIFDLPNEPLDRDKMNFTCRFPCIKVDKLGISFAFPWKKFFITSESANLIEVALNVDLQVVLK
jgi:hypothetical protein